MTEAEVLEALAGVIDPELDEPLVELGFIEQVVVEGGRVRVELRLPTFWCSPNFSWLMAADVRRALQGLPEAEEVVVVLRDHHAAEEITAGVNAGRSFGEVFGSDGDRDLEQLRRRFRRKAFLVRQERLVRSLGGDPAIRIGDLPDVPEARAYLAVRRELGLECSAGAPVVTDVDGRVPDDPGAWLRGVRAVRVSMEGNAALCRRLLETRYEGEGR